MATLHIMVGLPCAGKTTLAKRIEAENACLRLTPDEWIERLFGIDVHIPILDAVRAPMETLLWNVAEKVLAMGGDVGLDFGFWARSERYAVRERAARLGARCIMHCPVVPQEELLRRLGERNAQLPAGCFHIEEERVRHWATLFERPDEDEVRLNDCVPFAVVPALA